MECVFNGNIIKLIDGKAYTLLTNDAIVNDLTAMQNRTKDLIITLSTFLIIVFIFEIVRYRKNFIRKNLQFDKYFFLGLLIRATLILAVVYFFRLGEDISRYNAMSYSLTNTSWRIEEDTIDNVEYTYSFLTHNLRTYINLQKYGRIYNQDLYSSSIRSKGESVYLLIVKSKDGKEYVVNMYPKNIYTYDN